MPQCAIICKGHRYVLGERLAVSTTEAAVRNCRPFMVVLASRFAH